MIDFNGKITTFFSIMQVFLIYSEFTPNFVRFTPQTSQLSSKGTKIFEGSTRAIMFLQVFL